MEVQDQIKTIRRALLRKQKGDTAVALPAKKRIVIVATNRELSNEHYYRRLRLTVKNLMVMKGLSRRRWVEFCIAFFRDMDATVEFRWPSGTPYLLPDWDTLFKDADARWLSYFLQEDTNGVPKIVSHLYSRLRIFDLVIRALWPNIAKWIRA